MFLFIQKQTEKNGYVDFQLLNHKTVTVGRYF